MADKNLDKFVKQLVEILPDIHKEFAKTPNNELTRGMITLPQMNILHFVSYKKKCTMGELAKWLSVSLSAVTGLTDRMIKHKLLLRNRNTEDRRIVWISITTKGEKIAKSISRYKYNMIKRLFNSISKQDRKKYIDIISKVRAGLITKQEK